MTVRFNVWRCGLALALAGVSGIAGAGQQSEERLADSVRVLLRQAVSAGLPELRPFASRDDEARFYRWRSVMSERIVAHVPSEYQRLAILNAVDY